MSEIDEDYITISEARKKVSDRLFLIKTANADVSAIYVDPDVLDRDVKCFNTIIDSVKNPPFYLYSRKMGGFSKVLPWDMCEHEKNDGQTEEEYNKKIDSSTYIKREDFKKIIELVEKNAEFNYKVKEVTRYLDDFIDTLKSRLEVHDEE